MVDRAIVNQWIDKADNDLSIAEYLYAKEEFREAVGFHAQQAAEKYLKAYIVTHELKFQNSRNSSEVTE